MEHKNIACVRCGKCCFVDMIAYAQPEDFERWRREKRDDILKVVEGEHLVWAGDRMVSSQTGAFSQTCPFLISEGDVFKCSIYETRPRICRDYKPGSSEICPQWPGHKREGVKK